MSYGILILYVLYINVLNLALWIKISRSCKNLDILLYLEGIKPYNYDRIASII